MQVVFSPRNSGHFAVSSQHQLFVYDIHAVCSPDAGPAPKPLATIAHNSKPITYVLFSICLYDISSVSLSSRSLHLQTRDVIMSGALRGVLETESLSLRARSSACLCFCLGRTSRLSGHPCQQTASHVLGTCNVWGRDPKKETETDRDRDTHTERDREESLTKACMCVCLCLLTSCFVF